MWHEREINDDKSYLGSHLYTPWSGAASFTLSWLLQPLLPTLSSWSPLHPSTLLAFQFYHPIISSCLSFCSCEVQIPLITKRSPFKYSWLSGIFQHFPPLGNVSKANITIDLHFCSFPVKCMEWGDPTYLKLPCTPPRRNMDPFFLPDCPSWLSSFFHFLYCY